VALSSRTGTNTVNAISATLNSGDNLTGGSGTDTLVLSGGGTFSLAGLCWLERVRERDTEHDGLKLDAAQWCELSVDAEVATQSAWRRQMTRCRSRAAQYGECHEP